MNTINRLVCLIIIVCSPVSYKNVSASKYNSIIGQYSSCLAPPGGYVPIFGTSRVYIIGEDHTDARHQLLISCLKTMAGKGNILLGLESIPRDQRVEDFYRSVWSLETEGCIFGLKDVFTYDFLNIIKAVLSFEVEADSMVIIEQFLLNLAMSANLQHHWENIKTKQSIKTQEIYTTVTAFLTEAVSFSDLDKQTIARRITGMLAQKSGWDILLKILCLEILENAKQLPEDDRPPQIVKLRKIILGEDISEEEAEKVLMGLFIEHTNKMIAKNIEKAAITAADRGIDVYVVIGFEHCTDLNNAVSRDDTLHEVVTYDSFNTVPSEMRAIIFNEFDTSPQEIQRILSRVSMADAALLESL